MSRRRPTLLIACLAFAATSALWVHVWAHVDDSKVFDRIPAYDGPGYKAAGGADYEGGVAADPTQFASDGITLLSWLPLSEWPGATNANVVEGYVSQSGREYAILGLSSGTAVVEVTNPGNATKVAFLGGAKSLWRDIRTYGTHAYAISEGGGGIQVFDLSQIDNGVFTQVGSVTVGGSQATHTLFIDQASGFLYRAGGGSGLRIYSLANPASPTFVAEWADRYVHEVTVVTYTSGPYAGKQIAFACGGLNNGWTQTGLSILDVTNKAAITTLVHYQYPNARYSHQCWPTANMQYVYLNDEKDEQDLGIPGTTRIINIANLSAPVQVASWTNGLPAIDHNLYIKGDRAYLANYRSGLRVLDVSNPVAPVEIAWFDTFPGSDAANFNGLWDCDPFLPSGIVLGSDIERGLFVWYVGPPPLELSFPEGLPDVVSPDGQTVSVRIDPLPGQAVEPGTVRLKVVWGQGTVEVPATSRDGVNFSAAIPALPCLEEITYAFTAKAKNGFEISGPTPGAVATVAYDRTVVFLHDFENGDAGWTVGAPADDATAGQWVLVDPVGTTAQPEDDHTPEGTKCWVTGQGEPGWPAGVADVDNGSTTLNSHVFDATGGGEAVLSYWRWYSNNLGNNPNEDSMPISLSGDGGATWTLLEDVSDNTNQWTRRSFRIADVMEPTATMKLKFVARDLGFASLVEAAVDDVMLVRFVCQGVPPVPGDIDGDGKVDAADLGLLLAFWGQPGPSDLNGDGVTDGADLGLVLLNWTP